MAQTTAPGGDASSPDNTPVLHAALRRVARFVTAERMLRRSRKVLCAVSGGADSIAMLLVMKALSEKQGFEVMVGHFDHQLREDSLADRDFVRELATSLGLECITGEGDVRARAAETGVGIEATAREMRYGFLSFLAGNVLADRIATGHTRDDQAETVLQRVLRGSGVRGVRGMLPRSPAPVQSAMEVIRPLLVLNRQETEAICAEAGIVPQVDPSNADPRYTRNRLRNEVLPLLEQVEASVASKLIDLAASAREVFALVEQEAAAVQPRSRGPEGVIFETARLRRLTPEALLLVIEREAGFFKHAATSNRTRLENVGRVLAKGTGSVRFGDVEVEASCGVTRVGMPLMERAPVPPTILNVPGTTAAGAWFVDVSTRPPDDPSTITAVIDRAYASKVLRLRTPQPGDRIQRGSTTPRLRKVLEAARVPKWERDGLLLITAGEFIVSVIGATAEVIPQPTSDELFYVRVRPRG